MGWSRSSVSENYNGWAEKCYSTPTASTALLGVQPTLGSLPGLINTARGHEKAQEKTQQVQCTKAKQTYHIHHSCSLDVLSPFSVQAITQKHNQGRTRGYRRTQRFPSGEHQIGLMFPYSDMRTACQKRDVHSYSRRSLQPGSDCTLIIR